MTVNYNGKKVHEITTNQSMSIEDVIALFVDTNDQKDLEANRGKLDYIYLDDDGNYCVDFDNLDMVY